MSGKIFFGFFLLFTGLGFLFGQLNIIEFSAYWSNWWPVLLIAFGVLTFFNGTSRLLGLIVSIVGMAFLLFTANIISGKVLDFLWPSILIIAGLWFMLPFRTRKTKNKDEVFSSSQLTDSLFFSSKQIKFDSKDFVGGSVSVIFGNLKLDFSNSFLTAEGTELEINNFFGSTTIIVPKNWKIKNSNSKIIASFENKTQNPIKTNFDKQYFEIKSVNFFGSIEIVNL
jgi:predicted membrane protein